ncbi:MAG: Ketoacyl-ACP synthase [Symbiobacteriaceae bacterium]|jgi:3-oxoacyl-[acyl-carrier-protein] synthase II|nr:Ketoacyl-ACP synthase [Symbiobacteriaceae bacterium]
MTERIALSGFGVVSPMGAGLGALADGLLTGRTALRPITRFRSVDLRNPLAGEVDLAGADHQELACHMLGTALQEGLAGWRGLEPPVVISTTVAGGPLARAPGPGPGRGWLQDPLAARPDLLPADWPRLSVAAACASAGAAVAVAHDLLRSGQAQAALVLGAEVINPFDWMSMEVLRATSRTRPRPFDRRRDGVLLAEGAGAALFETESSLRRRDGRPLAWLAASAATVGGYDMVGPETSPMTRCMAEAINMAGERPDYIHAHATATRSGDIAEATAVKSLLGAFNVPVSSHKGAMGHGLRVSGFFSIGAALTALQSQAVPPTVGLEEPDPECGEIRHVIGRAELLPVRRVLINNFGFGGNFASLMLTHPEMR